ncbi:AAA family ATPase [Neolewinella aurantiaca]|uniref:AAA family ATPase n=1 Tax=Neolewinella aurantiaca TaxID=2602767 RepID=A0A5C7FGQ8_9BACT|nr:AAA family ATPase [Neolewinella aurantiaca]TXF88905.1 AAA family ATPase [Neolewinella aurantiaca]
MTKIDKAEVLVRKNKLEACKVYLKGEFVGIDSIIDSLIDYIQIWYLMPEILSRPIILNLWGMTGVGKTDLVRKMVKFLDYQDRFAEVELSNTSGGTWASSVSQILAENDLNDEQPGIVLFDEIQRFNTIDNDGSPLHKTQFADFWELLSDGRLSRKTKQNVDNFLFNYTTTKQQNAAARKRGEEVEEQKLDPWSAKRLRKSFNLDMSVAELTRLNEDELIELILEVKRRKKIYEPVNHSKTLIIISGNLDEAFSMASHTSETDIDADIYHAFTKKITVVDIKNALSRKFYPEQVARFGNIHLIYTSLRRKDFEELIEKEVARVKEDVFRKIGIKVNVTKKLNELIYRNGVFSVQGVRPVFSSVIDILESNLSQFMFEAIMKDEDEITVDYDDEALAILASFGSHKITIPYVGRIDSIRRSNQEDVVANISVHESGHAVAYMHLMGLVPLQLKSKIASSQAGGFTFSHQLHLTKENILKKIRIYLAGGIAEEIIFGAEKASTGRSNDREEATTLAIEFVRRFGFNERFQSVVNLQASHLTMDMKDTDAAVEAMMVRLVQETRDLLAQHLPLLKALSKELTAKGIIEAPQMVSIAKEHGLEVSIQEEGFLNVDGYYDLLHK